MHKLSVVVMVLLALGLIAHAQETPKVEGIYRLFFHERRISFLY